MQWWEILIGLYKLLRFNIFNLQEMIKLFTATLLFGASLCAQVKHARPEMAQVKQEGDVSELGHSNLAQQDDDALHHRPDVNLAQVKEDTRLGGKGFTMLA